jgi:RimJ/RimL family protein N-acetyltransferase
MIDFEYGVHFVSIDNYDDMDKMRKVRNMRDINKWCRQTGLISANEHEQWIHSLANDRSRRMYIIKSDVGSHVGVAGLTDIDHFNQRAEFSLLINPEHQRQGYARKALKTLFSHGFSDLNLNVIWGETLYRNPALKLFTSLGMTIDGVRPFHYFKEGRFVDANLISIVRTRWLLEKGEW